MGGVTPPRERWSTILGKRYSPDQPRDDFGRFTDTAVEETIIEDPDEVHTLADVENEPKLDLAVVEEMTTLASDALEVLEDRGYNPDQPRDSDGKFAGGGSSGSATSSLREPDGGFTLDPKTGEPPKGVGDGSGNGPYAVALGNDTTSVFGPASDSMFEPDANGQTQAGAKIAEFVTANASTLSQPGMYVGGWHDPDTGMMHLDVSQVVPAGMLDTATSLGSQRDQIAVTDLSTFKSIPTGGKGG